LPPAWAIPAIRLSARIATAAKRLLDMVRLLCEGRRLRARRGPALPDPSGPFAPRAVPSGPAAGYGDKDARAPGSVSGAGGTLVEPESERDGLPTRHRTLIGHAGHEHPLARRLPRRLVQHRHM